MTERNQSNTTDYVHPQESNLLNIHKAMEYLDDGKPALRVKSNIQGDITIAGDVTIPGVVTVTNTDDDPLFTHTHLYDENDAEYTATNPLTIDGTVTVNQPVAVTDNNGSLTVDGTVSLSADTLSALENIGVTGTFWQATQPVSGTVTVQDGGGSITVDGTVNIGTMPEVEIKNDTGNPIPITGSVNIIATPGGAGFEFTSKNRLKVSTYQSVFFNTFQYSKETDVWDESTTNGATATYNANQSNVIMAVTSTLGSEVVRQTFNAQRYIPGRTSTLNFAIRMQTPVEGIRRRFGLFDERDGCYFEDSGDNYYCVLRSYASGVLVEDRVARADWNGDKLDGLGTSGVTANPEAIHMFGVEYEWYGAGQVKFVYIIAGVSHTIHTFNTANEKSLPWCTTPFLPIRLELTNVTGVAGTHYLYQGSNSLISEGVPEKLGIGMNITSPIAGTTLTTKDLWYPVLSIRIKTNGLRGIVLPVFFQVATTDNTTIFYKLVRNATLGTGGNGWTDHPDVNAFTQYQTYTSPSAISEADHGRSIDSGFVAGGGGGTGVRMDKDTVYQIGRTGMGTGSDTLTLIVASPITNKTAIASMTWIEQR